MQIVYKTVQSNKKPLELDISSSPDIVYIRRNIKEITTKDSEGNESILFEYQEAQLNKNEYAAAEDDLLIAKINGEDNSKEYEEYKTKLNTGIEFTNGHFYKPKWISIYSDIIKDFKEVLELYKLAGGDISGYLAIKTNIYDVTGKVENAEEMSIKEIIELYLFLYMKKEQYFNEYKQAAAGIK